MTAVINGLSCPVLPLSPASKESFVAPRYLNSALVLLCFCCLGAKQALLDFNPLTRCELSGVEKEPALSLLLGTL